MKSQTIVAIANAWTEFKQSVSSSKDSYSNLRLLFPFILALILLRDWLVKGSALKALPPDFSLVRKKHLDEPDLG